MLYRYEVTRRGERRAARDQSPRNGMTNKYSVGDKVWVKPGDGRCDTQFNQGVVTGIVSEQAVEVSGVPRHVRDLQPRDAGTGEGEVPLSDGKCPTGREELLWTTSETEAVGSDDVRRSERVRRQPDRLGYQ